MLPTMNDSMSPTRTRTGCDSSPGRAFGSPVTTMNRPGSPRPVASAAG